MRRQNPTLVETDATDPLRLLDRARAGDSEAFCELCRTYETGLLRQAFRLCGNLAQAEDLAQDTLVESWRSLDRFRGGCQFFTWLCAILLNRYRNLVRRPRPIPFSALPAHDQDALHSHGEQLADQGSWPDAVVQRREQAAVVQRCLQALPVKHQQVIYLRFYVDDSLEGIAAALGCSVGTVKSRLFYALENLRKMQALSGSGGHPEAPIELL